MATKDPNSKRQQDIKARVEKTKARQRGEDPKPANGRRKKTAPQEVTPVSFASANPSPEHRQFAINACYSGLRNACYQPMVAAAMLYSLGVTIEEGQEAAKAFGDI